MQPKKRGYQVSRSRSRSPFLAEGSEFSFLRLPSPVSLAQNGFILSYASLLYRVLLSSVRPESEDSKRLPWGSRSLFATSTSRIQAPSRPKCSVPCRPRRFARPRRFTPRLALWACFIPLPRPGFTLQGFIASSAAALPFSNRCPLVVRSNQATSSCPLAPLD